MNRMTLGVSIGALAALAAGVAVSQEPVQTPARASTFAPETYTQVCAGCHGADLSGGRGPSLFAPALLGERTDQQLHDTIANGVPGAEMPAFKDMYSDPQIWELVSYLRIRSGQLQARPIVAADPDGQVVTSGGQKARIEVVTRGLNTPWALAFLPDRRMLVTERSGGLRFVSPDGQLGEPVKGTPTVLAVQDGGMLDMALHPDYRRNGWIYLSFSERLAGSPDPTPPTAGQRATFPPSMTVIVRGKVNARNEWVDQQVLYRAPPALYYTGGAHYGSRFLFDGKGHLFYSIGERGVMAHGQELTNPLGKVHRINDDGSVPSDNPFVGTPGAVPTIWSYGNRNPEGMTWEPGTGRLWASEHGPTGGDEINIIEKGGNYGWGVASMGFQPGITQRSAPGMIDPLTYWTPSIAPSGLTFVTGDRYPGWKGNLLVAGLVGQQLRRLEVKDGKIGKQEIIFSGYGRTRSVVQGPDGYLYALMQTPPPPGSGFTGSAGPGMILRLVPVE